MIKIFGERYTGTTSVFIMNTITDNGDVFPGINGLFGNNVNKNTNANVVS
jgi:uncharacterized sporulation protein YeaH/YhbH (DUF444 family)